jgi:transcriptional regulator with XRE-family HTH domain
MTPDQIKKRRHAKKLTQIEAAIKIGVSISSYRLWEQGGVKPSPENEARLIEVLRG